MKHGIQVMGYRFDMCTLVKTPDSVAGHHSGAATIAGFVIAGRQKDKIQLFLSNYLQS